MDIYQLDKIAREGAGDSDKHSLTLYSIAIGMNAKRILELGVRNGASTGPLLLAATKNGGHLTSVDINDTSFSPAFDQRKNWTFVKKDAVEFLRNEKVNEPYDLIFIDDWHSYEHVKAELEEVDRLVSPRSVILLHDLMYGNTMPSLSL
jgi:predicted O-methyltransferase YrrM